MAPRPAPFRKSDLTPVFQAAKDTGYDHVSVIVETGDGRFLHITAGASPETAQVGLTKFEKWKANRAP